MADTTYYVDTDVIGGLGDGSSWANAYDHLADVEALNLNLTTGATDGVCTIYYRGATADTAVTWNGWTTDAAGYINIIGDFAGTKWDATKCHITTTDANCLDISDNHFRISGVQFSITYSAAGSKNCIIINNLTAAGNDVRIDSCYFMNDANALATNRAIYVNDIDAILKISNCIFWQWKTRAIWNVTSATTDIYNCTICGPTAIGIDSDAGTVTATDCAVFNTDNDFDGTITIDYCASDDGDGTNHIHLNENAGGEWTAAFANYATGDFAATAGGPVIGVGVDDPGGGLYSDDITGTARTSIWDIGADEYVAAGGGGHPAMKRFGGVPHMAVNKGVW